MPRSSGGSPAAASGDPSARLAALGRLQADFAAARTELDEVTAAMRRDIADLDARLMAQDWAPLLDWLRERIWRHGSRWPAEELTLRATGEPLTPAHYRRHLETRYGAVTTS